nr:hypothetical protein [Tanacetum cinerariifolium]
MCDVHLVNNPTPLEAKDQVEIVINSNDDISSSDDDSLHEENIEYLEASPHDSELVSLEAAEIVIPKVEEIEHDNLREKLLNVHLLIANIKALKDNPTQSSKLLTKSFSTSLKSFLEETNTFHNSLPEFENFYFDLGEISSGSTTTHSDISLSEYDSFIFDLTHEEFVDELAHIISLSEYECFYFRNLPDPGELMFVLNSGICENLLSTTTVNLPIKDDYSPLLGYVVWIFLAYLTYPVIPPYLYPFGNEDTIFDPGITINHFYSFKPVHLIGMELSRNSILTKKLEEKQIEEEQAAQAQNSKIPVCYDDDDDYSAVTPSEPIDSLSMGDEHLNTISATESDEFIKSCVEDLVPILSESEGENGCDVPSCFTTFSNILFDTDYDFESVDDQSLHNEDVSQKIFSNPLFEEEIISIKKNQHHFNAESDLVESMLNHDSSIISCSSKIDSLRDEFAGELTLLKSIPQGIDKTDCHPENEICLSQRLLYENSSPRPPEEFNSKNSNADIESFSPSPILVKDSDSHMEEINLSFNLDDPMPPSIEDDEDSEGDTLSLEKLLHDDLIPLPDTLDFSYEIRVFLPLFTYPLSSIPGNLKTLAKGFLSSKS